MAEAATALLLDTCAALWLIEGVQLAPSVVKRVDAAAKAGRVYVSPITAWETAQLVAKRRIFLSMSTHRWFEMLVVRHGVRLAPLTPEILIDAAEARPQPTSKDPADRIIAATARTLELAIVTRDGSLLDHAREVGLRAVAC